MSKTFVMIKPDAIRRNLIGRIISRFEDASFRIIKIEMKRKDNTWFEKMYSHLEGDVYQDMQQWMLHTPLIGIILEGPYVIERVRKMIGATSSVLAAPGTIRGDYGSYPIRRNCVHASDSEEAVEKEITLFWS